MASQLHLPLTTNGAAQLMLGTTAPVDSLSNTIYYSSGGVVTSAYPSLPANGNRIPVIIGGRVTNVPHGDLCGDPTINVCSNDAVYPSNSYMKLYSATGHGAPIQQVSPPVAVSAPDFQPNRMAIKQYNLGQSLTEVNFFPPSKTYIYPDAYPDVVYHPYVPSSTIVQPYSNGPFAQARIVKSCTENYGGGVYAADGCWYPCYCLAPDYINLMIPPPTLVDVFQNALTCGITTGNSETQRPQPELELNYQQKGISSSVIVPKVNQLNTVATKDDLFYWGKDQQCLQLCISVTMHIEAIYSPLKGINMPHGRPTLLTPKPSHRSP